MPNKKLLFPLILIAVAAAIVGWRLTRGPALPPGVIKVSGTIEVTDVEASFKIPGRILERLVDEGDTVKAGQVLARLDDTDQAHEVAARLAEMETAQAALAELKAGSRREEIAQAEAALERARSDEERVRIDFHRQEALYRKEVVPARELDNARSRYEGGKATVREAAERLALVRKGPRQETIDQARARLRDMEAALALAKARLGYTTLAAPAAGIVLSKNAEPGELVAAGAPVVTIGDINSAWLRAYISETDLGRVKVGQRARVTSDTWPGKAYDGRITFISPQAEFTPKNVQTEKERVKLVYRIKIDIPNPQGELKPGMPADAAILTDNPPSPPENSRS